MLRFFTLFFSFCTILGIIAREHFILGSLLLFSRWILVIGLLFALLLLRKKAFKKTKIIGIISLVLLLADWTYDQLSFAKAYVFKSEQKQNLTILKVLSFNVYFKCKSPQVNINTILEYDPDILFCQEITPQWKDILDKALQQKYPHQKIIALRGTHGVGVYSKFPLSEEQQLNNSHRLPYAHLVTVNHPKGKIITANTHLASPAIAFENPSNFISLYQINSAERKKQWKALNRILAKHNPSTPKLIVGDLNTLDYEPLYRTMRKTCVDTYQVAGEWPGFTFPNSNKLPFKTARLDYILLHGNISTHKTSVAPKSSSDHFAVYAALQF